MRFSTAVLACSTAYAIATIVAVGARTIPDQQKTTWDGIYTEAQAKRGEALYSQSCASCHGDATSSMRGVAARYPAFDTPAARPFTLAQRIDACRVRHQQAEPLAHVENYRVWQRAHAPATPR